MVIAPCKHVRTIYELSTPEQTAIWEFVADVLQRLLTGLKPDRFSLGFTGPMHNEDSPVHAVVHVVPRRRGEIRGGIQWVTDGRLLLWKK